MRSFPPIREAYRGFDVWSHQFKRRDQAERYIKDRNTGGRAGRVDDAQSKLLDYNFGPERYVTSHHTSTKGREYVQLSKQTTVAVTIRGKDYRRGWFVPLNKDEQDPEFKRLTIEMIEADKRKAAEREAKKKAAGSGGFYAK